MRHLLSTAANPRLALETCLRDWRMIALRLKEPNRKRRRQVDVLMDQHCVH